MPVTAGQLKTLSVETTNAYLRGLRSVTAPLYPRFAQEISMSTKTIEAPILGMVGPLREWIGPRMVERLGSDAYSITAKKYEKTIAIPRDAVEDDNIGLYMPQISDLGQQAESLPDQAVFAKLASGLVDLCFDKKPFFSATHPDGRGGVFSNTNLIAGQGGANTKATWYLLDTSKAIKPLIWARRTATEFTNLWNQDDPNVFFHDEYVSGVRARGVADYGFPHFAYAVRDDLNAGTFDTAMLAMQSLQTASGESLNVQPNLLIVPTSLRPAAEQLFGTELTVVTGGTGNVALGTVSNTKFKAIEWIVASRLPNAANTAVVV